MLVIGLSFILSLIGEVDGVGQTVWVTVCVMTLTDDDDTTGVG